MNLDDEARRLINDALSDAYKDAPKLNSLNDLVANIAAQLWADDEARAKLAQQGPHADLLTLAFHELGEHAQRPGYSCGGVMINQLARIEAVGSELLPLLSTPKKPNTPAAGYAIANYVTPDDEPPALLLIVALVNDDDEHALLWAIANDQRNEAHRIDPNDDRINDDLRRTALALVAATQRKAGK